MTRTTAGSVREYYRRITDIDIGRMAREILAERIVQEGDRLLQCDCPHPRCCTIPVGSRTDPSPVRMLSNSH